MARTKKRFEVHRIKTNHSYTLAELAETCRVHPRATQAWRKDGMPVLDDTSKPLLVMGYEAKRFLKERVQKRKHPLGPDEFYCPKCRCARQSRPEAVQIERTGRRLGRTSEQVIIRGNCVVCDCRIFRFSSGKRMENKAGNTLLESEREGTLSETGCPPALT